MPNILPFFPGISKKRGKESEITVRDFLVNPGDSLMCYMLSTTTFVFGFGLA